jgi:hypothetical protein
MQHALPHHIRVDAYYPQQGARTNFARNLASLVHKQNHNAWKRVGLALSTQASGALSHVTAEELDTVLIALNPNYLRFAPDEFRLPRAPKSQPIRVQASGFLHGQTPQITFSTSTLPIDWTLDVLVQAHRGALFSGGDATYWLADAVSTKSSIPEPLRPAVHAYLQTLPLKAEQIASAYTQAVGAWGEHIAAYATALTRVAVSLLVEPVYRFESELPAPVLRITNTRTVEPTEQLVQPSYGMDAFISNAELRLFTAQAGLQAQDIMLSLRKPVLQQLYGRRLEQVFPNEWSPDEDEGGGDILIRA